ncbi:hypothetical protein [Nocardia sp. NPDC050175]|uniref:hypothetical protein n=1 Tax=Nocardia sp. NPDC050175 TaxID=3364317 RepID=UPI0037B9792B
MRSTRTSSAYALLIATVLAAPSVLNVGSADAEPASPATKGNMMFLPLPPPADTIELMFFTPEEFQVFGEGFCTNDDMSEYDLNRVVKVYRSVPGYFGTKQNPKDPISEALKDATGVGEFTNKSRKMLCTSETKRTKYVKALVDRMASAGFTYGDEFVDDKGLPEEDPVYTFWTNKFQKFKDSLAKWIKQGNF